jgi:endonuclease YncB( thermonuclease family)
VRVVDGDTVRLILDLGFWMERLEQPYRLLRINAPEMSTVEGQNARAALVAFLADKALVAHTQKSDNFGRFLTELYANSENVSDYLVANGFAAYQNYR